MLRKLLDHSQVEILLLLICLLLFAAGSAVGWLMLWQPPANQTAWLILLALLLVIGAVLAFFFFWQLYRRKTRQLIEEASRIVTIQPTYRVRVDGPGDLQQLAQVINTLADHFQASLADQQVKLLQTRSDLEAKIGQARATLEQERNKLAILMADLAEGVLVCNLEGQILLYNNRAGQLLSHAVNGKATSGVGGWVGLGHSIFGLIDRHSITHALEELAYRSQKQQSNLAARFVTTTTQGQLLRVRLAPVLDQSQEISGFILTLEDITRQLQTSSRRDILLQSLIEGIRASLGSIRAAIETIEGYPEMDAAKLGQLRKVIYDESMTLSTRLNQTTAEHAEDLKADWQLEEMLGSDLLWAIQRRFEDKLNIATQVDTIEENLWLKVDSYSIVQAMTYIVGQLKADFEVNEVTFNLKQSGRLAALDMTWQGIPAELEKIWGWQNQALILEGEGTPLTLREVAERHGGEAWCQSDRTSNTTYFRLLLPTTQPRQARSLSPALESRPEYYDFDLFSQPAPPPEVDEQLLSNLVYTVFDTETTGLSPSAGDEIIAIGAVRIAHGRLLRQEIFDQLVDPHRAISPESVHIHGISLDMVQGQPTIEQVLPEFMHFTQDTVLVGHNVAFDLRMLQLKEAQTGLKFSHPVLDVLLLSAVVQPDQKTHSLEAIAQRLGLNIIGRHTSLGDAILTGEIFLKFIPLLAERGVVTLKQARLATQQVYSARRQV